MGTIFPYWHTYFCGGGGQNVHHGTVLEMPLVVGGNVTDSMSYSTPGPEKVSPLAGDVGDVDVTSY